MSWAVGFDRDLDRFRGYGVPAYCDATGCRAEIDRGLGYVCECAACREADLDDGAVFCCDVHTHEDVDWDVLPPEHPDWVHHLLTDESWQPWREENPAAVETLREAGR